MSEDITILQGLRLNGRFSQASRLYYYRGNFFQPLQVDGCEVGRIKRAMRQFCREHREKVEQDRARPGYRTLVELFDEQMAAVVFQHQQK